MLCGAITASLSIFMHKISVLIMLNSALIAFLSGTGVAREGGPK